MMMMMMMIMDRGNVAIEPSESRQQAMAPCQTTAVSSDLVSTLSSSWHLWQATTLLQFPICHYEWPLSRAQGHFSLNYRVLENRYVTSCSACKLGQPAISVKEQFLKSCKEKLVSMDSRMQLHLPFLHAAAKEWEGYITYLLRMLEELVGRLALECVTWRADTYEDHPQDEKACFSPVERTHHGDYDISFKEGLRIQTNMTKVVQGRICTRRKFPDRREHQEHYNERSEHEASYPAAARPCRQKVKIAYTNVKADAPTHANHGLVQLTATPRFRVLPPC